MVTDAQVRRLKRLSKTEKNQEIAAAKAGMDPKTARKYLADGKRLPSERKPERTWRTRAGSVRARCGTEIQRADGENPGLEAKTLFEALQREYPGEFADGQLRTLQRRIKRWRATEGPAREVFFAQQHVPGRLGQSDFTHMTELADHDRRAELPAHAVPLRADVLELGGTRTVCYSESFESLSEGLQNALWELGGVPLEHRTDRLSTRGEQHERREGVHSALRSADAALRDGRPEDPSRQGRTRTAMSSNAIIGSSEPWTRR